MGGIAGEARDPGEIGGSNLDPRLGVLFSVVFDDTAAFAGGELVGNTSKEKSAPQISREKKIGHPVFLPKSLHFCAKMVSFFDQNSKFFFLLKTSKFRRKSVFHTFLSLFYSSGPRLT